MSKNRTLPPDHPALAESETPSPLQVTFLIVPRFDTSKLVVMGEPMDMLNHPYPLNDFCLVYRAFGKERCTDKVLPLSTCPLALGSTGIVAKRCARLPNRSLRIIHCSG